MATQWDRRKGEPETAFAAFAVFLTACKITVDSVEFADLVYEQTGLRLAPGTLRNYCTQFHWRERKRAYQSWQLNRRMRRLADSVANESPGIERKQTAVRRMAIDKALLALGQLNPITEPDAKAQSVLLGAIRQAMEIAGIAGLDHAAQLRRISSQGCENGGSDEAEDSEVIPPIPPESGPVQLGDFAAETILEPPA